MNISQEKIDSLNAVVTINIKPEDYQPRVEKAIKDHAKKQKYQGSAQVWCRRRISKKCMEKAF